MSAYFLKLTKEDKDNILDKHKTLYDGYAIRHNNEPSQEQPLYVQDFANDKQGITVNSKGEVSAYNNMIYMKESTEGMEEGIYDVEDLNKDNKFDYVEEEGELDEIKPHDLIKGKKYKYKTPFHDADIEYHDEHEYPEGGGKMYGFKSGDTGYALAGKSIEDFVSDFDELEDDAKYKLKESLEMFNRFKNYN